MDCTRFLENTTRRCSKKVRCNRSDTTQFWQTSNSCHSLSWLSFRRSNQNNLTQKSLQHHCLWRPKIELQTRRRTWRSHWLSSWFCSQTRFLFLETLVLKEDHTSYIRKQDVTWIRNLQHFLLCLSFKKKKKKTRLEEEVATAGHSRFNSRVFAMSKWDQNRKRVLLWKNKKFIGVWRRNWKRTEESGNGKPKS